MAATLTVTHSETLTLNGTVRDETNSFSYTDVNNQFTQTMSIATGSLQTLLTFGTASGGGSVIRANFRYWRVKNRDATNFVMLRFIKSGAEVAYFKLKAGEMFVLTQPVLDAGSAGDAFGAFADMDTIAAQADTAAVIVETFTASA